MTRILIVEDDDAIAALLADYAVHSGFAAERSLDAGDILQRIRKQEVDVVLLDLMLPGMDGLELCKAIRRESGVPVIIISARVEEVDRLLGLELGADDYVCKPFSAREVMARIKAILRRQQPPGSGVDNSGLQRDASRLQVSWRGQNLSLTTVEFALIEALAEYPGQIRSRQQLMDRIYSDHRVVSDRTIDSHIKKLRHKLSDAFPAVRFIDSVYGAGYRLDIQPQDACAKDA